MSGATRLGPYELGPEIGRGGMAVVFRARGPAGQELAIKLLTGTGRGAADRFAREVRLLESLGEAEGFVPLLDSGDSPHGPWLVMPYLAGGTLRDRLRFGSLDLDDTIDFGRAIASALGRAHARGIVHRDLKPENVLFTAEGVPLVADLGIAKHVDSGEGTATTPGLSRSGELRGTIGYMAPEQATSSKTVGPASDVFALGAILYECLAGAPAFPGTNPLEVLGRVATGDLEPLGARRPDAPRWLVSAVERALASDPRLRFPSGAVFA